MPNYQQGGMGMASGSGNVTRPTGQRGRRINRTSTPMGMTTPGVSTGAGPAAAPKPPTPPQTMQATPGMNQAAREAGRRGEQIPIPSEPNYGGTPGSANSSQPLPGDNDTPKSTTYSSGSSSYPQSPGEGYSRYDDGQGMTGWLQGQLGTPEGSLILDGATTAGADGNWGRGNRVPGGGYNPKQDIFNAQQSGDQAALEQAMQRYADYQKRFPNGITSA